MEIGIADLMIERRGVHRDQFVAGREDGNLQPAIDTYGPTPDRCQQGDLANTDALPGFEDYASRLGFNAPGIDVLAGLQGAVGLDDVVLASDEFQHDNRIGSL